MMAATAAILAAPAWSLRWILSYSFVPNPPRECWHCRTRTDTDRLCAEYRDSDRRGDVEAMIDPVRKFIQGHIQIAGIKMAGMNGMHNGAWRQCISNTVHAAHAGRMPIGLPGQ